MKLDTPPHTQHLKSIVTREDHRLAIAVALIAFGAQLPGLFWGVPGGKSIVNAIRIMDGEVPYRDFWTMYAPGQFYLLAALFKLFGIHIWVSGIAVQVIIAFESACLVVLSRRLGLSRVSACVIGAAFVGIAWGLRPGISSYEAVLLFLFPAIDRVAAYARAPSRRRCLRLACSARIRDCC